MTNLDGPEKSKDQSNLVGRIDLTERVERAKALVTDSQARHLGGGANTDMKRFPEDVQIHMADVAGEIYDHLRFIDARHFTESPGEIEKLILREIALELTGNNESDQFMVDRICDLVAVCGFVWGKEVPPSLDDLMPPSGT